MNNLIIKSLSLKAISLTMLAIALMIIAALVTSVAGADSKPLVQQSIKNKPPVVLIVLDEFPGTALLKPDGSFQKERYPHLNALKNTSSYYPYHSASSNFTLRGVPAILSGIVEREVQPEETLFNDFRKMGYRRLISQPLNQIAPLCQQCIISQPKNYLAGIKTYDWRSMLLAGGINDLKTIKNGDFSFVHALYPHIPWNRFPSGKQYSDRGFFNGGDGPTGYDTITLTNNAQLNAKLKADAETLVEIAEQRFIMQAQFTDKIVGSIIKNIKASGNWNKTTLIITSDHGGAFTAGLSRRTVEGNATLPALTNVPLFIKGPYQKEGLVSNQKTRAISLSKFILNNLGQQKIIEFKGNNNSVKLWQGVARGYFEMPLNHYLQERQTLINRSQKRFASNDIFALNDFYGKKPNQEMTIIRNNEIRVNEQEKFNKVNLRSTEMKAGKVSGQLNNGSIKEIFVTVNGLVAGSGKTYETNKFNIMLNPKFFRQGKNIVKFFK